MEKKICRDCKLGKDISHFYCMGGYYDAICKSCRISYASHYVKKARKIKGSNAWWNRKYCRTKLGAKKRKIPFLLSQKEYRDIFKVSTCHYCQDDNFLSVDRIDNTKPYNSKNCVVACFSCNSLKSNYGKEDLKILRRKIDLIIKKL